MVEMPGYAGPGGGAVVIARLPFGRDTGRCGGEILKSRLNGFSLLKSNLESVPKKELLSMAPFAHEPPERGSPEKSGIPIS